MSKKVIDDPLGPAGGHSSVNISKEELKKMLKEGRFDKFSGRNVSAILDMFDAKDIEEIYEENKTAIKAIHQGFDMVNDDKIKDALENMKDLGYEQGLQNACSNAENADPILMQALATMISGGNPRSTDDVSSGLYMQPDVTVHSKPQNQVAKAIVKLALGTKHITEEAPSEKAKKNNPMVEKLEAMLAKRGLTPEQLKKIKQQIRKKKRPHLDPEDLQGKWSNPIGDIQSWMGWNKDLDDLNTDDAMFSEEWAVAAGEKNMFFFPAIVKAYNTIKRCKSGVSQASTNINGGFEGAEFPIATWDLAKSYLIQDYGVQSIESTVCSVSDGIVIKVPDNIEIHLPCDGKPTALAHDDSMGNYTTVRDDGCSYIYTLGGLKSMTEATKKGDIIGYSTEKLIIKIYDENGKSYISPKGVWSALGVSASEDESIGQQIADTNATMTQTPNVIVKNAHSKAAKAKNQRKVARAMKNTLVANADKTSKKTADILGGLEKKA